MFDKKALIEHKPTREHILNEQSVVYCIDNNKQYLDMLLNSIEGIRYFNKLIPIKVLTSYDLESRALSDFKAEIIKSPYIFNSFPADKCMVGRVDAKHVLLLDADTFILGDIESVFSISNTDVSARLSYRYSKNWEEKYDLIWKANNAKLNIEQADIINSGVVVFRNYAHKKLFNAWVDTIRKFYNKELSEVYSGEWMFEQISLSMSIAKLGLKLDILDKNFHTFGWDDEEFNNREAIIIHTNCSKYKELESRLAEQERLFVDSKDNELSSK